MVVSTDTLFTRKKSQVIEVDIAESSEGTESKPSHAHFFYDDSITFMFIVVEGMLRLYVGLYTVQ